MIRLITATPGSGKTSLVVEWLLREIDKGFYGEYYSNIEGLTICGVRPLPDEGDWRQINPDKDKNRPPILVIIDEAQYFNAYMKETRSNNDIGKDLSTHRHYGIDIWFITQSVKLLNDYVIENVGEHVHLYRPNKRKTVQVYWWSYVQKSLTKTAFKSADDVQSWRLNPNVFQYYVSTSKVTDSKSRVSHKLISVLSTFGIFVAVFVYIIYKSIPFFNGSSFNNIHAEVNGSMETVSEPPIVSPEPTEPTEPTEPPIVSPEPTEPTEPTEPPIVSPEPTEPIRSNYNYDYSVLPAPVPVQTPNDNYAGVIEPVQNDPISTTPAIVIKNVSSGECKSFDKSGYNTGLDDETCTSFIR